MYDAQLGRRQEHERRAELLRELARQIERDAAKVCVAQQVVQVVREQLENEAEVIAVHEVTAQFDYVGRKIVLVLIHEFEQANFDLSLLQEGPLVFNDLYGYVFLFLRVECFHYLAE